MTEIVTTLEALTIAERALARLGEQPMSAAASYRLMAVAQAVDTALGPFKKAHEALVRKYGEERPVPPDERGKVQADTLVMVKQEHVATFSREYQELVSESVHLPITPFDLSQVPSVQISAKDIQALGPLVTWTETT